MQLAVKATEGYNSEAATLRIEHERLCQFGLVTGRVGVIKTLVCGCGQRGAGSQRRTRSSTRTAYEHLNILSLVERERNGSSA